MTWKKIEKDILYQVSSKIMNNLPSNMRHKVFCSLEIKYNEIANSFHGIMFILENEWTNQIPITNQTDINKALKFLVNSRKKNYKGKITFTKENILTHHILKKGYRTAIISEKNLPSLHEYHLDFIVKDYQPGSFEAIIGRGSADFSKTITSSEPLNKMKKEIERKHFK